jgi:magnesium transporter
VDGTDRVNHRKRKKHRDLQVKRRSLPGSSPGVVVADPDQPQPQVEIIAYGPERLLEQKISNLEQIPPLLRDHAVVWVNVEGLGDARAIERLGQMFNLHRLALEDVVNLHQRAKVEEYGEVLFIVLRMATLRERCGTEQISIFIGPNFVISFQEGHPGDSFDRMRQRLRDKSGRLRTSGSDYLAYAMIDAVVDAYYPVLEVYAERIDTLEDIVLEGPKRQVFDRLHEVKSDLLLLRRAIWPQREAVAVLSRETSLRFSEATRPYLRDCYDHIVQIVELVETYRELTADLRDLYMSTISNRINETMRVLTVMSSLFIPLTFIAGIYGMNFHTDVSPWNMPELSWYYGYPLCLLGMAATAVGLLIYFYRQGWIFQRNR